MNTVPLRHVATVASSSVDKKSVAEEVPVRLCNYTDVYKNDEVRPTDHLMKATATPDEVRRFRLAVGDTVITKDSEDPSDIGVAAYIPESADDFICGYHLAVLRPTTVDPRFLYWSMRSRRALKHMSIGANGMTRYGLGLDTIKSVPIHVWPTEDQRRIADFLDDRVARLDDTITARSRQIEALLDEHRSRLQAIADRLSNAHGPVRLRYRLAAMEQGWSPQADSRSAEDGEWGVMRAGCVNGGTFRESDNKALPDELAPRTEYELRPGDLLVSRASGSLDLIGSTAVVPEGTRPRLLLCDKIYRLRLVDGWEPGYVAAMLRTTFSREAIRLGVSGAEGMANNLPSGVIRDLYVPNADHGTQLLVLNEIEDDDAFVACMRAGLQQSIALLTEYKQSVITAAVTGELDVTTAQREVPA